MSRNRIKNFLGIGFALFIWAGPSAAEDFPDSKMDSKDFEKVMGAQGGVKENDQKFLDQERLKIGGSFSTEAYFYRLNQSTQPDNYYSSPLNLSLYLDSQLREDVRFFFRGRLVQDSSVDESKVSPITGSAQKQAQSTLEELRLSFPIRNKVFFTLGRQKIKWGSGQFWNPTDFINQTKRDIFRQEDERAGVGLIKAHIPISNSNFYLISVQEKSQNARDSGFAARLEWPFKAGEFSLTHFSRAGAKSLVGADLSLALPFDFDFIVEASRDDQGKSQATTLGLNRGFKYNDEDAVTIGFESFSQQNGVDSKDAYSALLLSGNWTPFFIAKRYSSVYASLPSPGSWNDSSFTLSAISNDVDSGKILRLVWSYAAFRDLNTSLAYAVRSGEADTEFRLLGQSYDVSAIAKLNF